jgi:hypothetical protein
MMTTPIVRMYETQKKARDAAGKLRKGGFHDDSILLMTPPKGEAVAPGALEGAVTAGFVPANQASVYAEGLQNGRSLVAVRAPFGSGQVATNILESCGPVETGLERPAEPEIPWIDDAMPFSAALRFGAIWSGQAAPFSRLLGIPTQSRARTFEDKYPELTNPDWTFSSKIGFDLLSHKPSPASVLFGVKSLLDQPTGPTWTRSFGLPLLSGEATPLSKKFNMHIKTGPLPPQHPAPFSEHLGLPTLSRKEGVFSAMFAGLKGPDASSWTFSEQIGLGLLSSKPAPDSSLGLKTLSGKDGSSWEPSFKLPMLSENATPLSSTLGFKVLRTEKVPLKDPAPLSATLGLPTLASGPVSGSAAPLSTLMGKPLLSDNPAPLSAKLEKPVLSQNGTPLSSKYGLPLLSRKAAPLSSLFRLPLLVK